MVAYQYAKFYAELKERYDKAAEMARMCLHEIETDLATPDDADDSARGEI